MLIRDGEETRLGAKVTVGARGRRRRQLPHLRRRRVRAARGARPGAGAARRARGEGERRARARRVPRGRGGARARRGGDGGAARVSHRASIPISFEVIRNALVAATDEMVLALKRSAYSTNIKTRSDFSCAFFDAELRSVAQAFTQPVHLGLDGAAGAVRDRALRRREPRAGRRDRHQRSAPARGAPERRQPDLAGLRRRRADRLRREPRPPRRRRRRRARVDRRLPARCSRRA